MLMLENWEALHAFALYPLVGEDVLEVVPLALEVVLVLAVLVAVLVGLDRERLAAIPGTLMDERQPPSFHPLNVAWTAVLIGILLVNVLPKDVLATTAAKWAILS